MKLMFLAMLAMLSTLAYGADCCQPGAACCNPAQACCSQDRSAQQKDCCASR